MKKLESKHDPPKWVNRILARFCRPEMLEGILGDLEELFQERLQRQGPFRAKGYYLFDAIGFLRPFAWRKPKPNPSLDMFINHLRIAFRNLARRKTLSLINISGFAVGISCCLFLFLYIQDELAFDQFHEHKDHIVRLSTDKQRNNGEWVSTAFSGAPWAPALKAEFPEIKAFTRFMRYRLDVMIQEQENRQSFYERDFVWADSSVFDIFSFPLIKGDPKTALQAPHTVVISASAAKKYFGDKDPIGKVISYEGNRNLTITGVMEDIPKHSHFKADFLASFSSLYQFWDIIDNWSILYYYTYLLLDTPADQTDLAAKFPAFLKQHMADEEVGRYQAIIQPMNSIHLRSNRRDELEAGGNIRLLYLFGGIALLILLVACANYINMTTASAINRAKEIGVRKVLGSAKKGLIGQFLTESLVQMLMGLGLALVIIFWLLPAFNQLSDKTISFFSSSLIFQYLALLLLGGSIIALLAAAYPAFYLSSIKPMRALKEKVNSKRMGINLRQLLILFQFAVCTLLIVGTLVIQSQFNFLLEKDPGFSRDQVMILSMNIPDEFTSERMESLKEELSRLDLVQATSLASHRLVGDQPYFGSYRFDDIPSVDEAQTMGRLHVDWNFAETYGVELIAGRSFDHQYGTDTSAFLINETAVQQLGLNSAEEAIGKRITYGTRGENGVYERRGPIIGVTKDFHFRSLHYQVDPMVMDIQPARFHFMGLKVNSNHSLAELDQLEKSWKENLPDSPFDPTYLDELLVQQYEAEENMRSVFSLFAIVAIILACLGLFGLSTYITAQRTKEISIRKVLGASLSQILLLLSKEVFQLIALALIIAIPLGWYLSQQWLEQFSYRIQVGIGFFVLATLVALSLCFITISLQAWRTAIANPIHALKEND
ncbi:MAG: ABC transporter permease [Saprospiraceae bacterium]|nr:ABC transporter permease [Saprospiraceae bacterium]